jgi:uncharacterized protein
LEGTPLINIETLKNISQAKSYQRGTIFSKDGAGLGMYVVLRGEVAILDSRDNKVINVVEPGDFFDEALLFSGKSLPNTSLAITDVIALPISKANIMSLIATEPSFIFELMKTMSERIEKINTDYEAAAGHRWAEYEPIAIDISAEIAGQDNKKQDLTAESKTEPVIVPVLESLPVDTHKEFELFPEGHNGCYKLALNNEDNLHKCEIDYNCPICGRKFKGLKILYTKLALSGTDNDTRKHYKDFEPVFYEVVTCPNCLYSALAPMFETAGDLNKDLSLRLKELKKTASFNFGPKPDTDAVFAGYYLALLCAPGAFSKSQLVQAKLLHKLSWIYNECKDEQMELSLKKQALEKYLEAYSKVSLSTDQEQQVCMIIGELYFQLGNIRDAKTYYYNTKMNRQVSMALRKRAESRFEQIKELELGQKS